eukprot:TRINITY_DN2190_c0_g1_i2.p1 TRINITY_DN2190_c0_g1~~TRINITY_DN2190_c0_g1_i2.p1  ORF type:complete len:686 (-),score=223.14 TRINITY_DN2190_c0_g1_i2:1217-3274(-)
MPLEPSSVSDPPLVSPSSSGSSSSGSSLSPDAGDLEGLAAATSSVPDDAVSSGTTSPLGGEGNPPSSSSRSPSSPNKLEIADPEPTSGPPQDGDSASSESEDLSSNSDYQRLIKLSLNPKVAERLSSIYQTGKLSHKDLDGRALDALKEFAVPGAIAVLNQFQESNLEHVTNKSAYLCGVMKTYRQKSRSVTVNGSGSSPSYSSSGGSGSLNGGGSTGKGPDEKKIKAILERTGYTLDVTTGQRKFGGPPPNWDGPVPGNGCEVFCGKIPRDLYEDELIPLFEKCGTIWDLRLMMDPMTGLNRGYAFITFTDKVAAQEAVKKLDSYEMSTGKNIKVNVSQPKTRLFIGNIPKCKDRDEIVQEFCKFSANLREVIIYSSPDDKKKNRGFCFLEYESHKAASLAKRRLETGRIKVWSCDIIVDWADPQEEPDEDTMAQVKVLYVRNLTVQVMEEKLRETFEVYGEVYRVKKIKDYGFVHFEERQHALNAMEDLSGKVLGGAKIEISLAKPPFDKKKKEEMLRKREQRMMKSMAVSYPPFPAFSPPYGHMASGMYSFGQNGGSWGRGNNLGGGGRGGMRGNSGSGGGGNPPGWNWYGWNDWTPAMQRGGPPMSGWMGGSGAGSNESWGGPGGGGGGHMRGYPPNYTGYVNSSSSGGSGGGGNGVNSGHFPGNNRGRQQQRNGGGGYTR